MSTDPQDGSKPIRPVRPPPLPLNVDTLGPALRSPPPQPQPTNWKKVFWIIGLSLLTVLGFVVLIGALFFGGCMWLVKQLEH